MNTSSSRMHGLSLHGRSIEPSVVSGLSQHKGRSLDRDDLRAARGIIASVGASAMIWVAIMVVCVIFLSL